MDEIKEPVAPVEEAPVEVPVEVPAEPVTEAAPVVESEPEAVEATETPSEAPQAPSAWVGHEQA